MPVSESIGIIGRHLTFESVGAHLSHESIAKHLIQSAEARSWLLGFHFDSEVSSRMNSMAHQGAETILSGAKDRLPEWKAERYARAATQVGSEAMVVFVEEMNLLRILFPGYVKNHRTELGIDLWEQAHIILCPLWPICRA